MLSNDHALTPAPASITPELLTLRQTSQLCGVSERTLFHWARSGISPPPIKFGHNKQSLVRYSRTEYETWLRGGCQPVNKAGTNLATDATRA